MKAGRWSVAALVSSLILNAYLLATIRLKAPLRIGGGQVVHVPGKAHASLSSGHDLLKLCSFYSLGYRDADGGEDQCQEVFFVGPKVMPWYEVRGATNQFVFFDETNGSMVWRIPNTCYEIRRPVE